MLALTRDFRRIERQRAEKKWERYPGALLSEKSVGILGLGAIAEDMAPRFKAFGMRVIGISRTDRPIPGFDRIYPRADIAKAVAELDYLVLLPRAVPGLLAGLAFLWIFLFVPGIKELKNSMWSIWIAYTVVWLAYGMRLIQSALLQVGPELEEAGRSVGGTRARVSLDVTLPLFQPPDGKPYGWQDPGEWNDFAHWMRDNELLENLIDAEGSFTNDYLPGQGP